MRLRHAGVLSWAGRGPAADAPSRERRRGGTFHSFTFRTIEGLGNGESSRAFAFQIFQRKRGGIFAFSFKRIEAFAAFFIFACTHKMEGWRWLRWGVTFRIFIFQI